MAAATPPPPHPTPPPEPETPATRSEPVATHKPVPHLELKATLLLLFTLALVTGAAIYLMYARGFFEPKQTVVLITDNSEGVTPGMDMLFSGFPIGRVRRVDLGDNGNVRITVDVNRKDAKWLRTSSVYTLVRGLVGGAVLRAYSGVLSDPELPDGAERPVLRGDANGEIQRVIGAARDLLDNLSEMTSANSELQKTIANLQTFSNKLQGQRGALHAVFGNERDAQKLVDAINHANTAMARIEAVAGHADAQLFGPQGLARDTHVTLEQLQTLLADARGSMKRVDDVLGEVQGIGANVKSGTADLGSLREEVEANLRRIEDMINDLNRKWPFAKDRKVELP
ncbi:MAG TPA: MlaD family protein [Ramlibacter sp.]|uniref:MlaD family protein n=1 Tax=Ramlibacter sp. TaxID=1917967 RepID=UPI002CA31746|nr:MlaD family protein [Ramlibacter sp.]HVZ45567.1 MlaD family protein [Ramlibacter sp.]